MVNDNDIKLASVGGSAEQANDVKTVMRAARTAYNNGDMIVTPNWDVYFVENGSPVLKGNIKGAYWCYWLHLVKTARLAQKAILEKMAQALILVLVSLIVMAVL